MTKKEAFIWKLRRFLWPPQPYPPYRNSAKENALCLGFAGLLGMAVAYLFFKSIRAMWLIIPCAYLSLRIGRHKLSQRKQGQLELQLRDYLLSVVSFLQAGYALENAMQGAEKEVRSMHGPDSFMGREAARMTREIRVQNSVENIWKSFGDRTLSEAGRQLAQVFAVARRQGGNYLPVLKYFVRMMDAQRELQQEIQTLLAGQRLEFYIMCLVPSGMLLFLDLSSPDLTRCLYERSGRIIMLLILLFYGAAVFWGDRILEKSYEKI